MNTPDVDISVGDRRKRQAKRGILLGFVIATVVAILALSVVLAGIIATVVYAFVFLMSLTFLPLLISLLGNALPGSAALGKGHIVLTAFAFDHHYLVDMGDRWEWCPGDEDSVYIEGRHIEIDGDTSKRSVFGWRPFGILRYKDADTYGDIRVDEAALSQRTDAAADGGTRTLERGGFREADRPIETGLDGKWIVDLKRVFNRGVSKIGDIDIIETAEEIVERGQVNDGRLQTMSPAITFFIATAFGVAVGFAYVYFMG